MKINKETAMNSNTTVTKLVKKFEALWTESLENRYQAAKVYYKAITEHPDNETRRLFHESEAHKDWTALRWRWIYNIGKAAWNAEQLKAGKITEMPRGGICRAMLDIHNYSLAMSMRQIPIQRQEEICTNGLTLYSKEHKGGVVIPLRKLNRHHIMHCFDIDSGNEIPVEQQRKKSLHGAKKEPIKFVTDPSSGKLHVSVQRKCVINAGLMLEILTHKNDQGVSILDAKQLYDVIHKLEA